MRKKRFPRIALAFVAGTIFGISLLAVVSFVNPAPPSPAPITPDEAKTLVTAYRNTAHGSPYAFKVDENMFAAMKSLNDLDKDIKEFRIYLGIENKSDTLGVVVALNKQGRDDLSKPLTRTVSQHSGMCPPVCDSQSPINLK